MSQTAAMPQTLWLNQLGFDTAGLAEHWRSLYRRWGFRERETIQWPGKTNWLGVLAGFIVYFVVGAVWFGPKTFYPAWARLRGKDPAEPQGHHGMAVVFGMTALGTLGGALGGLLLGIGLVG